MRKSRRESLRVETFIRETSATRRDREVTATECSCSSRVRSECANLQRRFAANTISECSRPRILSECPRRAYIYKASCSEAK